MQIAYLIMSFSIRLHNFIRVLLFFSLTLRLVGLRPAGFGIFIGVLMFEALIAISLGLAVSAAVPTVG